MTKPECTGAAHDPSAFLHSGVLVDLFLLWDACTSVGARLNEFSSFTQLAEALSATGVSPDGLWRSEDLVRGMRLFNALCAESDDYMCLSSRVCWAEAHHALLEARGLENLVL